MARDIVTGSLYSNTVESDQELHFGPRHEKMFTVKPVLNSHSQKDQNGFQYRISLNTGLHSAILSSSIKLPVDIKNSK